MCYNSYVSLTTFIFGCIIALLAYYTKAIDNYIIIILLSFTSMQLLEFFAWTYYNNPIINNFLSILGLIIIIIQIFLLNYYLPNKKESQILLFILAIVLLLFLIFQVPKIKFEMKRGKNKHLLWYWLDLPIIWIIIGLSFYLIPAYLSKYSIIFYFVLITLIISLYFYWKYKTWGSMWCYLSNIGWIIVLLQIIKINLKKF